MTRFQLLPGNNSNSEVKSKLESEKERRIKTSSPAVFSFSRGVKLGGTRVDTRTAGLHVDDRPLPRRACWFYHAPTTFIILKRLLLQLIGPSPFKVVVPQRY